MIVGVPKEIKRDEYRVALLPVGVEELTRAGHTVLVEKGSGLGSGIPDERYAEHGAKLLQTIRSADFRKAVEALGGYDARASGEIVYKQ